MLSSSETRDLGTIVLEIGSVNEQIAVMAEATPSNWPAAKTAQQIDANQTGFKGTIHYKPNMDAVQEVRVLTSNRGGLPPLAAGLAGRSRMFTASTTPGTTHSGREPAGARRAE